MANGQETIEALTKQFTEAFRARDFAAVGNMYTNDAVICPPNSNMITGKGNIQSFWERNGMILALRFDSMSVKPLGETAMRVVGTFSIQVRSQPQGGGSLAAAGPQSREVNAKYIFVWQKIGEDWKIESSIWNRIGPERGSFPMPAAIRRLSQNNPGGGVGQSGPGGGMGPASGPRGGGMDPGGGPRGGGMGPGGGPRGGGMGQGGGPRGGGMGQGGPGGGMGPGGGPRGGGMGQGGGPRGGGTGPGSGPRGGGMDRGGPGGGQADPGGSRDDSE